MSDPLSPHTADAVVIGGGVLGCSAAYHLGQGGAGRVVLLERAHELGRAAGRHAAAGVHRLPRLVSARRAGRPPDRQRGDRRPPPSLMRALSRDLGFTRADSGSVPADVHGLPDTTHRYHLALARELAAVVPALGSCVVKEVRNGIPTRTPDLRHMLGQLPGVGGCYFLGADYEIGVTHGPGLGRGLAELVVQGRSSADLSAYLPDRW